MLSLLFLFEKAVLVKHDLDTMSALCLLAGLLSNWLVSFLMLWFITWHQVCTGAKSEQQSKLAARKYARIIQKLGFPAKFKDFKIQNIVGSCDVKFPIRLEGLAYSHGAFSSYEPELFPGLIYRMKQPKIVLLIFVSGKIVLTGAKVREETYTAFENIYPVLTEFRKVQQWIFGEWATDNSCKKCRECSWTQHYDCWTCATVNRWREVGHWLVTLWRSRKINLIKIRTMALFFCVFLDLL